MIFSCNSRYFLDRTNWKLTKFRLQYLRVCVVVIILLVLGDR